MPGPTQRCRSAPAAASTTGRVIAPELTGNDVIAGRQVRRYPNTDHVDVVMPWDQTAA